MAKSILVTRATMLGIVSAYVFIAIAFVGLIFVQQHQSKVTYDNRKAIAYICSTTSVLDALVVAAGGQIQQNLESGTYDRLFKQGILTQESLDAARLSRDEYQQAHIKLSHNSPCEAVR